MRKKARDLYMDKQATGGGPSNVKELTEKKDNFYKTIITPATIEGDRKIPELGLHDQRYVTNVFELEEEDEREINVLEDKRSEYCFASSILFFQVSFFFRNSS